MSVLEEISSDTLVFLQVGIVVFKSKMKPKNASVSVNYLHRGAQAGVANCSAGRSLLVSHAQCGGDSRGKGSRGD